MADGRRQRTDDGRQSTVNGRQMTDERELKCRRQTPTENILKHSTQNILIFCRMLEYFVKEKLWGFKFYRLLKENVALNVKHRQVKLLKANFH